MIIYITHTSSIYKILNEEITRNNETLENTILICGTREIVPTTEGQLANPAKAPEFGGKALRLKINRPPQKGDCLLMLSKDLKEGKDYHFDNNDLIMYTNTKVRTSTPINTII